MSLRGLSRHEAPAVDEAALAAARDLDALLAKAREIGAARWEAYLAPYPDLLRDAPPSELRAVVRRVRAAYGPKDSIADVLPWVPCMTLRDDLDNLWRILNRTEAVRD